MDAEKIIEAARERGEEQGLPYAGALTPAEAHALLQANGTARLVDVRTKAELDWVGRVPGAVEVEWQTYPSMAPQPDFIGELERKLGGATQGPLLFICRSGGRSHAAAALAAANGFEAFNVLEGFEGDRDSAGHRGNISGWRKAGLPWTQG